MRAITGGIVSSEPCPLRTAVLFFNRFTKSAAPHLPSSDCSTYLRSAAYGTAQLCRLREELGGRRPANFDAHDYEDPVEGDRRHQDQESEGDLAVAADGSHRDSAAGAELDLTSGKKKGKKKKKKKKNENPPEDRAVAHPESHIPPSPEIATEKRKKKHSNKEIIVDVKQEPRFVVEEELVSEKKKSKKKKEKDHVKLEDVNEVEEKIFNDSAAEQRVARKEREGKKKKHEQEDGVAEVVKEEKTIANGDLDIEKKRKKKRGRGDVYDNAPEQVEHPKKKQKKHSGD